MYPHREPNERKGPASLAGNCRRLGDARAGCGKKGKGSPPLTNLYPAPPSAAAGLPSHRALTSMRVREVGPVGCLQAVHELLECMRQPFGLIRRPYRHRRRQFCRGVTRMRGVGAFRATTRAHGGGRKSTASRRRRRSTKCRAGPAIASAANMIISRAKV
jgi:hypothetical protein